MNLSNITLIITLITLVIVIASLFIPKETNIGDGFVLTTIKLGKDKHPGFQIAQKQEDGTLKPLIRGNKEEGVTIYGGIAYHHNIQEGVHSPLNHGDYTLQVEDWKNPDGNHILYSHIYQGTKDGTSGANFQLKDKYT